MEINRLFCLIWNFVITTHFTKKNVKTNTFYVFSLENQIGMVWLGKFLYSWSSHINFNNHNITKLIQKKNIVCHFVVILILHF